MGRNVNEILQDAIGMHLKRNNDYGDSYKKFGPFMKALFPDGIPMAVLHSNEFGVFMMMVVKFHRLAMSGLTSKDSAADMIVYSAMMTELIENGQD